MAWGDDDADKKVCTVCGGGKTVTCTICSGTGQEPDGDGSYKICRNGARGEMTCPHCGGSGWEP